MQGSNGLLTRPRRAPLWRSPWLVGVAVFCGFMFAAAGTAAIPSSALWTGRIVCSDPYHLAHQSAGNSFGNTSQSSVSFSCVNDAGNAKSVGTLEVLALQFALGASVAYVVLLGVGSLVRFRRTPSYP